MSHQIQLKEETKETGFSLQGGARPVWSAIGSWFGFVGLLTFSATLLGALGGDSRISLEGNLILMYIIGIMTAILAFMAARMTMTGVSNRLYSRQLIEKLGEEYLSVKLRNSSHLGYKTSPNSVQLTACAKDGQELEIDAFLARENGTSSETYCTYRLVIRPV